MNKTANTKSELVSKAYESYADEVMSLFLQYNICREDAEDLVQEVFMKVLNVDTLCGDTLKGLVMVAAYNIRKDYFRKKLFRRAALQSMPKVCESCNSDEMNIVANNIIDIEKQIASNLLNETNNKVYSLCRYAERTSAEIADEMGLDLRNVESRLYYARKIVRSKLARIV